MHKSLRECVEKRRVGVKAAVASIGTCLHRWNERRLSGKTTSSPVAPITEYQDSTVISDDHDVFRIGIIQVNDNVDDFVNDPELSASEMESNHSGSEYGDDGEDGGDDAERLREEDCYQNSRIHNVLEGHC